MYKATSSEPHSGRNKSHSEFICMLLYSVDVVTQAPVEDVGHSMIVAVDKEPGTRSWFNGSEQIWFCYWQIE